MKTIKVLLMAVSMAFSLFSCVQETGFPDEESSKLQVNLTMGFTLSSEINTRSTRPLTSIDSWQRVTDMRVYLFYSETGDENSFKLYYPLVKNSFGQLERQENLYIPEFDKTEVEGNDGIWKQPEDEEHSYVISPMLDEGFYRLLAVGYDDPNLSPVTLDWEEKETTWETAVLTNKSNTPVASEIFTGFPRDEEGNVRTIHVVQNNDSFEIEIECRRAVAGVLMYLKNIPSHFNAEESWEGEDTGTGIISPELTQGKSYAIHEVALVTVGYNQVCNAVTRHWEDPFKYDNSRFKLTRLAWIELDPEDEDVDGGYHRKTFPAVGNFVMPSETYKVKYHPLEAKYSGGLSDPDSHEGFDKSLYLCFFTKTGSGLYYPVKLWPVKLVRSYTQDEDLEDECAGDLELTEDNPFNYNLVANHLYCLGMYKADGTINQPVDLEKEKEEHGEELIIKVLGSWQYEINIEM